MGVRVVMVDPEYLARQARNIMTLRAALVGLVGCDDVEQLRQMLIINDGSTWLPALEQENAARAIRALLLIRPTTRPEENA